jgi:hypothetical protein
MLNAREEDLPLQRPSVTQGRLRTGFGAYPLSECGQAKRVCTGFLVNLRPSRARSTKNEGGVSHPRSLPPSGLGLGERVIPPPSPDECASSPATIRPYGRSSSRCWQFWDAGAARPPDQAGSRHHPSGGGLPSADERAGCRPDHGARLSGDDRPAGALPTLPGCRRPSRADPDALSIGRDRRRRPDQPLRRRAHPYCSLRSGPLAPRTQPQVVGPARLGHEDRQGKRHGAGPCRSRPQARCHPAPHVERPDRVPLRSGARGQRPYLTCMANKPRRATTPVTTIATHKRFTSAPGFNASSDTSEVLSLSSYHRRAAPRGAASSSLLGSPAHRRFSGPPRDLVLDVRRSCNPINGVGRRAPRCAFGSFARTTADREAQ